MRKKDCMGDVGIMNIHVPGMSLADICEAASAGGKTRYSCITAGEAWGEMPLPPCTTGRL